MKSMKKHGEALGRNQTVSSHPFSALTQDTKTEEDEETGTTNLH